MSRTESDVTNLRVEQNDIRREVADLRTGLATLHGDLKVNNALTTTIKESVSRIETNTASSFDRIEKHTRESLDDMRATMADSNKKVQGAIDMAAGAKVLTSKPLMGFLGWAVGAGFAVISIAYLLFRGHT